MPIEHLVAGGFLGNRHFLVTGGLTPASGAGVATSVWNAAVRGVTWTSESRGAAWKSAVRDITWTSQER